MEEASKHSRLFFDLCIVLLFFSIAYGWWRIILEKNFDVYVDDAPIPFTETGL